MKLKGLNWIEGDKIGEVLLVRFDRNIISTALAKASIAVATQWE